MRPVLLGGDWHDDLPGGLNRYLADLLVALRDGGTACRGVVIGPARQAPVGVVAASTATTPLPLRLWSYTRAAGRIAAEADVVDAHFALYAWGPVVRGRLRRVPLVVHFQGPWADEDFAGGRIAAARVAAKRGIERSVYRRASAFVTLSGAFKRMLVEQYGVSPWAVDVIPPGVHLGRFVMGDRAEARRALGVVGGERVVLAVRRLVPRMGLDVLLDAWSNVRTGTLLLVGEGPERERLEARARHHGVAGSVRFLGRVDEDTLVRCYQAADVSVVPSLQHEGFGLIVLESLACGTPVIATDVEGLPEAVAPLDPSLVVPAGDARALADRLDGGLPAREECRAYAESFSWPAVAQRHRDIYAGVQSPDRSRRLRVVFVDHCARLSGGELAMLRLLPALRQVDAHVVLAEDGPLVGRLLRAGVSVEVLPLRARTGGLSRDRVRPGALPVAAVADTAAYAVRLARRLRTLAPDLVHTNSLKSAIYGGVAARIAGVPVIWHVRDRIAADYLPSPAVRAIRTLAHRLPAAVIANSAATLATLGEPKDGWAVVPSPVHVPPPSRTAITRPDGDELRIGIVGRLAPWKGQHVFLEAFAKAFPSGGARAVIVGEALFGEDEYARRLAADADALGIADRTDFLGFREDVEAEISRLDVLVHASTIPEPFGQVVVEGMAMGLPVIASAAGGPAEVVDDGVNGLLAPPGDAAAIAAHLRALAADNPRRAALGAAARERAAEFSAGRVAPRIWGVYVAVLGADRSDVLAGGYIRADR